MGNYRFAAVAIGFGATVAQLALMRELLVSFNGNELTLGVILGFWLLFTGLGSYMGGRVEGGESKTFERSLALSVLLLPLSAYLAQTAGGYILVRGEAAGFVQAALATSLALFWFCAVYGFQLALVLRLVAQESGGGVGRGYILDSLGSALGGAVFSFALIGRMDSLGAVYVAGLVNAAALFIVSKRLRPLAVALSAAVIFVAVFINVQGDVDGMHYPGMTVLAHEDSRYGSLLVARSIGEVSFFEDGLPLFSTHNIAASEETIHYAMAQRENPKRVLIIGGGVSGTLKEALKYHVDSLDYVELDPEVIRLARSYAGDIGLDDVRTHVINEDGLAYLREASKQYDIIIVDLPEPSNARLNRFYTAEFFQKAKDALNPGGVFSTRLPSGGDYMSLQSKELNAGVYRSLKAVFRNVLALPAGKNVYLASDSPLSPDIASLVAASGVRTDYVNGYYLGGILTKDRREYLDDAISVPGRLNTDFVPVSYYDYMGYWMNRSGSGGYASLFFTIVAAAAIIIYLRVSPAQAGILAVGFSGMALEVAILIAFQAMYGYVYSQAGLIVTAFMAGIVLGAYLAGAKPERLKLGGIVIGVGVFSLLMPALMSASPYLSEYAAQTAYAAATLILGALVGAAFPAAARPRSAAATAPRAGDILGLDFFGAFAGCVLVGSYLIPTFGLFNVCFLTTIINVTTWLRLRYGEKRK